MVIMELPDGTTCEYALNDSDSDPALRLVSRCASFDLVTALTEMGWRIRDVTTHRERERVTAQSFLPEVPLARPPCQQPVRSARSAPRRR
jgi:hypothetical protein